MQAPELLELTASEPLSLEEEYEMQSELLLVLHLFEVNGELTAA